ncbi:IpaD/SipD/SspD family type III secretion system needle tip protein [Yersinia canariae]|uniref:IpaD/SipD/SspD family type III secretion system needle tip protein n=1 Tax=Yersinia canariae TaxID=2607663 RepID=A0A857F554_9GAMM|nr:IpaD/SipD/SspD family type III secretion system needle tip protein [Yersinia canariae]QHB33869.1 IpaD/SipD/SspD family type III secretion system needle tip protein [Yersinia canariae]
MTTSISFPQHAPERMHSAKMPVTTDIKDNKQVMSLQDMKLSIQPQFQADPYTYAQQLLDSNSHLLPSPKSDSYVLLGENSVSTDADKTMEASRQLGRNLKQSSDAHGAAASRVKRAVADAGEVGSPPHIEALKDLISSIHGDYQTNYAKINEGAAKFMKDVNTALGTISNFISAGKDGKIVFEAEDFAKSLHKGLQGYTVYSVQNTNDYKEWSQWNNDTIPIHIFKGDEKTLDFWTKKLGDGFIVRRPPHTSDEITIQIVPNLEPIRNIFSSISNIKGPWNGNEMQSQVFQSLQTAIDSQKSSVNNSVSQLLERFRQDNSTFETMIQLLTKMTEDLHRYNAGYFQ